MRISLLCPVFAMGVAVIFGIFNFYYNLPLSENSCNRCLYNSCPSSFLLQKCGEIQNNHIDDYFNILKTSPDETDRIFLYSRMYGKNMGECFSESRGYCRSNYCNFECRHMYPRGFNYPSENTVVAKKDIEISSENNGLNHMINSDSCYVKELDVEGMFTKCILSPFHSDCLENYSRNVSMRCRM